jgi:2-polyprenyl-3-methyl-5-hydroxy-6-metoxy-1,4-benzoquinol methylase
MMRIPNFLSEEGSILYKSTVGKQISPRVSEIVIEKAGEFINQDSCQVLDVGCGPGTVSFNLAKKYPHIHVTGIDSSSSMIKQCTDIVEQEGLKNVSFKTMNADTIQFPNHSFDFVVCNLAFPFFSKPTESMRGILDAMNSGGTILISVPGRNTWKEFFTIGAELLGDIPVFAKPFLSKFEMAETLPGAMEEAGFTELEVTHHLIPFTFDSGVEVLSFFQQLFELLNYVPDEIKTNVAGMIDTRFPNGFTMHYEAVIVHGKRPNEEK